jgi:hypothetical protein
MIWECGDTVGAMTLGQDLPDEDNSEQRLLKYFSVVLACVVGILAIISRWVPSIDLTTRIILLTSISFGTTIVLRRKELNRKATWLVLAIGASIHCIVLWASRDRLAEVSMWVAGGCAVAEGVVLQVSIEIFKPSSERWNS